MINTFSIIVILIAYGLALAFTSLARSMLVKRALLDHPNERSSHTVPVPRGGGWAVAAVMVPGMLLTSLWHGDIAKQAGLILGTIVLIAVSWMDDRKGLSVRARLSMHIAAACLGSLAFSHDQTIFGGAVPFWLDRVIMIVGWAWFINLYNFMDGIDGLTATETIFIASGFCLLAAAVPLSFQFTDMLSLLLTGACLGFLVFNWHPAKIFLGDVGSVPLGYLCGFLLLKLAVKGQWAPALILALYYLADSGLTLAKRALRGEKIWQAHREHFYQQAAQGFVRHDKVVTLIAIANGALVIASLVAVPYRIPGLIAGVVIVAILLKVMHKRGQATG